MDNLKSIKEHKILMALLTTNSQKEASETLGISEKTIYNYLQDSNFRDRLKEYDERMQDIARLELCDSLNIAVSTLKEIAEDKSIKASERIKACNSIIENACKLEELRTYQIDTEREKKLFGLVI